MDGISLSNLGERMRLAREHAGFSQVDAAETLGITSAAISQYESGKRKIDALSLDRLARLYGVSVSYFFQEHAEPTPDWEEALRHVSSELSPAGKAGVSVIVERLRTLESLYEILDAPLPERVHPPFAPLAEKAYADYQVRDYAERARQHFALGKAPVHDMKAFLEANGYLVFTIPLGKSWDRDLSGLYFLHPALGQVAVINEDQAFTRWPFTLAHEFAHGLYHHDRLAILCRWKDSRPIEDFANTFAGYFLVPDEALHEQLERHRARTVNRPEIVVTLSRYFGISFRAMARRLASVNRLQIPREDVDATKPVAMAKALGFRTNEYEFGVRPLPIEERFPHVFLRLAYDAVRDGRISLRRAAEMLDVSHLELEDRLHPEASTEVPDEPVKV